MNNGIIIGTKFYKYNDAGDLEVIRILKSKNTFTVVKDDDHKVTYIKTADELHEYTLLRPDALYTVSIVINAEDKVTLYDVVVTMTRRGKDKTEPYVVCRQMMQNVFAQMVTQQTVLGNCMSQDSCPPDVKFKANLICSKLVKTITIAGYLDDKPYNILNFAKSIVLPANKILKEQHDRLCDGFLGLCTSVKDLLKENSFWDEVNKGLKITKLNDKIENCSLSLEQLTYLEEYISYLMDKVDVVEYGHDIDLDKIISDYMLIKDSENKLYLVSYLRGSFLKQEHLNEEELAKFTSIKI